MLVDGKWKSDWHPLQSKDEAGRFVRQQSSFRNWVTADGSASNLALRARSGHSELDVQSSNTWRISSAGV
jgi:glutathionyl-hydroquinone reductase